MLQETVVIYPRLPRALSSWTFVTQFFKIFYYIFSFKEVLIFQCTFYRFRKKMLPVAWHQMLWNYLTEVGFNWSLFLNMQKWFYWRIVICCFYIHTKKPNDYDSNFLLLFTVKLPIKRNTYLSVQEIDL